jgi:hypothetical protein
MSSNAFDLSADAGGCMILSHGSGFFLFSPLGEILVEFECDEDVSPLFLF